MRIEWPAGDQWDLVLMEPVIKRPAKAASISDPASVSRL